MNPNSPMFPVLLLSGIASVISLIVSFFVFGIPRISGKIMQKKIRLTMPTFNYQVVQQSQYPEHTIIYLGGAAAHFTVSKGIGSNGISGYTKFVLHGVNEESDIDFKTGDNVFKFWTEWRAFITLVVDNGGEMNVTNNIVGALDKLKKKIESLNNLKVMEANEEKN